MPGVKIFKCVRIVEDLRGLSEANPVLGKILDRFKVIPLESHSVTFQDASL